MSENNSNSNKTSEWNNREIGAIWMRTSKDGTKKYMTGQITDSFTGEKQKIVIFKNLSKKDENGNIKNEKAPDFRIYKSEDAFNNSGTPRQAKKEEKTEALDAVFGSGTEKNNTPEPLNEEEISF